MLFGCIDMGGTKSIVALIEPDGTIIDSYKFPTVEKEPGAHFAQCAEELRKLAAKAGLAVRDLRAVGICAPGMFDSRRGVLMMGPGTGWNGVDIVGEYQKLLDVDVYAESDVRCGMVGDAYFSDFKDMLWMTLSTGLGGAILSGGCILPGANFCSGELGHNVVEYDNPRPCNCGRYGCVEAYAAGSSVDKQVARLAEENPGYRALFRQKDLPLNAAGCAQLAREGEPVSIAVFDEAGMYLGRALAQAINLLNPQRIVAGGGMAQALDLLLPAARKVIEASVVPFSRGTPIIQSPLGYNASLLGAMVMAKLRSGLLAKEGHWLRYLDNEAAGM